MTDSLAFTARAAAQYTGEVYTNTSNDLMRDAQTLLNLSLGLRALEGGWSVTGGARTAATSATSCSTSIRRCRARTRTGMCRRRWRMG